MKIIPRLISFVYSRYKWVLLILLALTLLALWLPGQQGPSTLAYWQRWESSIGLLTFIIAGIVLIVELVQEWRNSLPSYINLKFTYNDKLVLYCRHASLTHPSDLRSLCQQIGAQMCGGCRDLPLNPAGITITEKNRLGYDKADGYFREYNIDFPLKQPLEDVPELKRLHDNQTINFKFPGESEHRVWEPPFEEATIRNIES